MPGDCDHRWGYCHPPIQARAETAAHSPEGTGTWVSGPQRAGGGVGDAHLRALRQRLTRRQFPPYERDLSLSLMRKLMWLGLLAILGVGSATRGARFVKPDTRDQGRGPPAPAASRCRGTTAPAAAGGPVTGAAPAPSSGSRSTRPPRVSPAEGAGDLPFDVAVRLAGDVDGHLLDRPAAERERRLVVAADRLGAVAADADPFADAREARRLGLHVREGRDHLLVDVSVVWPIGVWPSASWPACL